LADTDTDMGIGKQNIGIGHIGIENCIYFSGYRYWPNIGINIWISAKISAYIAQNTSY
jgi:hypothetical protein